jgi:signal transduction histidine kinase
VTRKRNAVSLREHFRVDTHVFRELGELLVGRDSTALMELVKNSYDADASRVLVYGDALDTTEHGYIRIVDDGCGMTREQFITGFLTIASRIKEVSTRYSRVYGRRFTGAKGVGRLAAHKLARLMRVVSVAKTGSRWSTIDAVIDWDELERHESLEKTGDAVRIIVRTQSGKLPTGTAITLERLRSRWSQARREQFVIEATSFEPPAVLAERISRDYVPAKMILPTPVVRDERKPGDFVVSLEGEFGETEVRYDVLLAEAAWVVEIDGRRADRIKVVVTPTSRTIRELPDTEQKAFVLDGTADKRDPPPFQARILIRHGVSSLRDRLPYGIRVFMEGFRVLPYGDVGDDWLRLDYDAVRRLRSIPRELLPRDAIEGLDESDGDGDSWLKANSQRQYFGAVYLRESDSRLRMLVNREGFIPDDRFTDLVEVLRTAVYLSVRVRAAVVERRKELRKPRRDSYGALKKSADDLRFAIEKLPKRPEDLEAINAAINSILSSVADVARAADQINILASIGTLTASFVHEMSTVVGMARAVETDLNRAMKAIPIASRARPQLSIVQDKLVELRRQFLQQSSYLTEVVSAEARNRRSPQPVAERFDAACALLSGAISKHKTRIVNAIPRELRSSNMYPAELVSVMMNLLSNAIKAAGRHGEIRASGVVDEDGRVRVRIENTGAKVEPGPNSEKWFHAFESTTTRIDPELGQGMGLGLYITRFLLERRNASVKFAMPAEGFSTAVQIDFGPLASIKTGRSR